jgi:nucleotidyltransferase substrate binding protein (TIGR01987 family)
MNEKGHRRLSNFGHALDRLHEALAVPPEAPLAVDGTVQRFEFVFELAWKTLKAALEAEGVGARTPREVLREATRAGWLADEDAWLEMLEDRNLSSHTYSEESAREIYGRIRLNTPALDEIYDFLVQRYPPPSLGLF